MAPCTPAGLPTSSAVWSQHNAGRGGYYTRTHRPVTLVYREETPDRRTAMQREWAIKKLDRARKERLVELQG